MEKEKPIWLTVERCTATELKSMIEKNSGLCVQYINSHAIELSAIRATISKFPKN